MAAIRNRILSATALLTICSAIALSDNPAAPTAVTQPAATTQSTRDDLMAIINRPRAEPAPEVTPMQDDGDLKKFHFTYASEPSVRVPGILLAKPALLSDKIRHPVAVVLHGTGGRKEAEISTLRDLAQRDLIAVAIDGRFHGERGNQTDYNHAITQAFADGKSHPLYLDTGWDIMRLIDYLQTRTDVDPHRIGLMGISKGGIETWLTAAIDPRVAVAIPCISAQSFAWGLEHDGWHHRIGTVQKSFDDAAQLQKLDSPDASFVRTFYDRLLPGIYTKFDGPQMLPLIAPRPLLIISGETDPINPLPGVRLCEQSTRAAYEHENAADHFQLIVEPKTGHGVSKQAHAAAMDWFTQWIGTAKAAN